MKMKRYFSLFLALVLVCAMAVAPVSAAEVTTVTVESINDVAYTAGQEVVLDVSVANNVGYTNFNFGIVYDHTQLELVEIVTTKTDGYQYIPQGIVMPNENTDQIVFANGTEIKVNGTLFKLKFKVLSSATSKAADVSIKVNEFYNVKSPVVSKFVPGGVKVVGSTTGSTSTPGSIPTPGGNIANVDADGNIKYTTPGSGATASNPTDSNTKLDDAPTNTINGIELPEGSYMTPGGEYWILPGGIKLDKDGKVIETTTNSKLPTGSQLTSGGNFKTPSGGLVTPGGSPVSGGEEGGDNPNTSKPTFSPTGNGGGSLIFPNEGGQGGVGTTITVTNKTSQTNADAKATIGVDADTGKLTVSSKSACMVIVKDENGNYTVLEASKIEDGKYGFDVSGIKPGDEIIVATKGDFNGDGVFTAFDLSRAGKALADKTELSALQEILMTYNGKVTAFGLSKLGKALADKNVTW